MRHTIWMVAVPLGLFSIGNSAFGMSDDSVADTAAIAPEDQGSAPSTAGVSTPEAQPSVQSATPEPAVLPPQADSSPAEQVSEPKGEPYLEEVIVTAQRKVENAQKAGVALDVISGDDIAKAGIVDTRRLTEKIPALISNGSSNFVRGVGTFSQFGYTDPAVAVNYDGVYIGRSTSVTGLYFDLDRIELLKGPQGTLYGRNATGGALNILPAKPHLGETSAFGSLSYGNYQSYNAEAAVNWALTGNTAVRLSGLLTRRDGFLNDDTGDKSISAVRLQSLTQFTDDLSFRLAADYSHSGGRGEGRTYYGYDSYDRASDTWSIVKTNFDWDEGLYSSASQNFRSTVYNDRVGRTLESIDQRPYQKNDYPAVTGELNWNTGIGTMTVIPAWRNYDFDSVVGNSTTSGVQEHGNQYSLEARLSNSNFGILDYTVGAFVYRETIDSDSVANQQVAFVQQTFDSETKSGALFGRLTAHVTDRFRVIGGVRYTRDDKDFDGEADGLVLVCPAGLINLGGCPNAHLFQFTRTVEEQPFLIPQKGGAPLPQLGQGTLLARQTTDVDTSLSQDKPTYRGAIEFDLAKDSLFYASYETGYRSGGFSIATGYETYKPEEIKAVTVGIKNRFFHILQVNVEAFNWDYTNQQLSHLGPDASGQQNLIIQNIGKSTMRGAELEVKAALTSTTRIGADVQYLDSKYEDFGYAMNSPAGSSAPPQPVGCPLSANSSGGYDVDCSGMPAYNAPDWTVNLNASQIIHFDGWNLTLAAETQYRSSYFVGFEYRDFQKQPPVWRTSMNATLAPSAGSWSIDAFVRNLGNSKTLVFASSQTGIDAVSYMEPRTYGIRLTKYFD